MHVRKAKPTDASSIARVHVNSLRETYSGIVPAEFLARLSYKHREQEWQSLIATAHKSEAGVLVMEDSEIIIGFADGGPVREEMLSFEGELYSIYILREYQRKGLGTQLVSLIAQQLLGEGMHSMMLWVLARNPARHFYNAIGGKPFKRRYIAIGGTKLLELAYGWSDIRPLVASRPQSLRLYLSH